MDWGKKWLVDFNTGKTQLVSFDQSKNTGAIDVKMDGSLLEEKTSFEMLGLTFSSKLHWGSYTVSITKTASKKIGVLIRSMKFLSPEAALYLYKSTIQPCMEYCQGGHRNLGIKNHENIKKIKTNFTKISRLH